MRRILWIGAFIWMAGTVIIRLAGYWLLLPDQPMRTVLLYLASFMVMALLVPKILSWIGMEKSLWFKAVAVLIMPTLILDPFTCLVFDTIFPNLDPGAAGAFGGWMLICCGGAVSGVWQRS